ncbi:MAG: hypothetical protein WKG06_34270 [Segetibacter sp.]
MNNNNQILQELREICPLTAKISKTNVYSVSSSYFNNLSEEILDRINLIKEHAYNFPSSTPFSVPEDYFKNLSEVILQKVIGHYRQLNEVIEETEKIAPLLNTISKKPVYSIPPGFFDKIQIPSVQIKRTKAKVVSINNWSKFLKFSAAAVITSILAIGVYTITGRDFITSRRNNNAKNEVKNLSKEEIVNFLKI